MKRFSLYLSEFPTFDRSRSIKERKKRYGLIYDLCAVTGVASAAAGFLAYHKKFKLLAIPATVAALSLSAIGMEAYLIAKSKKDFDDNLTKFDGDVTHAINYCRDILTHLPESFIQQMVEELGKQGIVVSADEIYNALGDVEVGKSQENSFRIDSPDGSAHVVVITRRINERFLASSFKVEAVVELRTVELKG